MDSFFPADFFCAARFPVAFEIRFFLVGTTLRVRVTGRIARFSDKGFFRRDVIIAASFRARSSDITISGGRAGGVRWFPGVKTSKTEASRGEGRCAAARRRGEERCDAFFLAGDRTPSTTRCGDGTLTSPERYARRTGATAARGEGGRSSTAAMSALKPRSGVAGGVDIG